MMQIIFKLNRQTEIPSEILADAPTSGRFDEYAEWIMANYDIQVSLEDSIKYLKSTGGWTKDELQDLELNKQRLIWLACMDCKENDETFFYMGE